MKLMLAQVSLYCCFLLLFLFFNLCQTFIVFDLMLQNTNYLFLALFKKLIKKKNHLKL